MKQQFPKTVGCQIYDLIRKILHFLVNEINNHMPFPRGIWHVLPLAFIILFIGDVDPDPDMYVSGPNGSRCIITWTDPDSKPNPEHCKKRSEPHPRKPNRSLQYLYQYIHTAPARYWCLRAYGTETVWRRYRTTTNTCRQCCGTRTVTFWLAEPLKSPNRNRN